MKVHDLKITTVFFEAVKSGCKPFEVRINDRGFEVGDCVYLREWVNDGFTGRYLRREISFVLIGWGVEVGYVGLGFGVML